MENSSLIYVQGTNAVDYLYYNLSSIYGDSYFYSQEKGLHFDIDNDYTFPQSDSHTLARFDIRISGILNSEFEQQLVFGLGIIFHPSPIRDELIAAINNLVLRRPTVLTGVPIGVLVVINLYFYKEDGGDEEEEDDEGENEDDEEEEEDEEDNEFLHDMQMHRVMLASSPSPGFIVEDLETVKIEGDGDEDRCAVCLEEFSVGLEATKLPCEHIFHGDCVRGWLENRGTCPMCRSTLVVST